MLLSCSYKLAVRLIEVNDCTNKADYFIVMDLLDLSPGSFFTVTGKQG